jgi:hypothetical protein
VFFNKYDLFLEKVTKVPVTVGFHDFPKNKDPHNKDQVLHFFKKKFLEILQRKRVKLEGTGQAHFHTTTALDTDSMAKVIHDVRVDMITRALRRAGLLQ